MRTLAILELVRLYVLPWINAISLAMIAKELRKTREEKE